MVAVGRPLPPAHASSPVTPIRWTSSVRNLFLMPAVAWVLVFTIFPLGYALYAAFQALLAQRYIVRALTLGAVKG